MVQERFDVFYSEMVISGLVRHVGTGAYLPVSLPVEGMEEGGE